MLLLATAAALIAGCAAGPEYVRPSTHVPDEWKEAGTWKTAQPQPVDATHAWWTVYGDATLNTLMDEAARANQDIRQAEAQYRQATAAVSASRANLFPSLGLDAGIARSRTDATGIRYGTADSAGLSASWEPDLWGAVRRGIQSSEAAAQASADVLAAVRLSIQATLAQAYLQLRTVDQQRDLFADTAKAYTAALKVAQAQHAAGVALLSDVTLAQSQLATAQASAVDLEAQRAVLEHAIAYLTGRAPSQFSLAAATAEHPFDPQLPATPPTLPSELLERRPDIAAAESNVAVANANVGIARAAWFPSLSLRASSGFESSTLGTLFDTPSRVWAVGAALAQTLLDGGLRKARDAQAVAAYDTAVAHYKQTVLASFQQVEDKLATLRLLDRQAEFQAVAVQAAQTSERLTLTQYRAGTATYLSVVTAQQLSLANERAAVELRGRQLAASVGLITATGGGWRATEQRNSAANSPIKKEPNS